MMRLALVGLHVSFAEAQATYPPLVPEGEVFEDVEASLTNSNQRRGPFDSLLMLSSYRIAFSPDGKILASASSDNTVRLWNVNTGKLIRPLEGHGSLVLSVAFSPDGKTLASASNDRTVRLWNVDTGKLIRPLESNGSRARAVDFSPDGKTLASASSDRTVRLWNVDTGKLIRTLEGNGSGVLSVAFSPDGKTLASASSDSTVQLWNVDTGKLIRPLEGHGSLVLSVDFSPDGKTLASASSDSTVRLWNVDTGKLIRPLEGNGPLVRSVDFSPDGKTLASASYDSTVRLWNVDTGKLIRPLKGHGSGVLSVAFSPDGKTLASASNDSTVRLWNVGTGKLIRLLKRSGSGVRSIDFSPDGKTLASASYDSTIRLWNVDTGKLIRPLEGHGPLVRSVTFSPDGKTLASASDDRTVRLWNVDTGKLIRPLEGHGSGVRSVAFSPNGKTLASASDDRTVRLWNVDTGKLIRSLERHGDWVRSVAFSPDGKTLASASDDSIVRLWNVDTDILIRPLEGHGDSVRSVDFSPDGKTLASASNDRTVRLWNVDTGKLIRPLEGHGDSVRSVDFSPDGKTLASASDDRTVRLWNVDTGKLTRSLERHDDSVRSVDFSPDGKTLASGSTEIRLDEGPDFRTTAILFCGQRGIWIGCRLEGRCWRHDDGTLLLQRREDGAFEPIPPQVEAHPPQLELAEIQPRVETLDGESTTVTLTVRNTGNHRAFWLGVRRFDDPDDDPLVVTLPWNRPHLDPDEQADLQVRVSTHSAYDHPRTTDSKLSLEITSLHGEPIEVPEITVRSRVPSLEWNRARWVNSGGTRNLTVELTHTGNMVLENVELTAQLSNLDAPLSGLWGLPVTPGETIPVPFGLPQDAPITDDTRVTVTVRSLGPPAHAWTFTDRAIRPATPAWILPATIATALLALTLLNLFSHPLVRRLSQRPTSLLKRPPPDLPKARTLLRLTGRLGSVLRDARVERDVLDRAIDFWATDSEARFRRLAERLGVEATYTADTELQTLPLGAAFPLNLKRCLIHQPPADRPASETLAWLKARPETRDKVTLTVAADADAQNNLHRLTGKDPTNLLVVPSGAEMTEILLSPESNQALARIIASQVRRTHVSPYQTGGGVSRESIFFGREEILAHILSRELSSYLIVGGRQLGKTSLLQAIRRRLDDDPRIDVRYLALSGSNLSSALARSLGLPRASGLDAVLERLAAGEQRTLFLIDEADVLVRHQHQRLGEGEEDLFTRLRSLSEEGRCHFILTGFWSLYEATVLDYGSPLRNFGETLRLEALEADACVRLATKPMASMGLDYEEGTVARLVERTGRRANLIAIACNEIITNLEPTVRTIDRARVDAALSGKAVQDALEGWQRLADEADSRLDRAVVYATIERDSFTLANVLATLREAGVDVDVDRLERSLRRLELAWVIGEDDGTYTFRVPLFVERVRGQDPSLRLQEEARKLS